MDYFFQHPSRLPPEPQNRPSRNYQKVEDPARQPNRRTIPGQHNGREKQVPLPIVLCDLQGVGLQLASDLQGAYLIEEIKRNYPEKAVIAFTGGSTNSNISKRAILAADDYLRKDVSIEEWRDVLDKHIRNLSDPVYVWKQLRLRLIRADISPIDLLKLEHAYVSSIKAGAKNTKATLEEALKTSSSDPLVKREIASFVASKAFDLVIEAMKGLAT